MLLPSLLSNGLQLHLKIKIQNSSWPVRLYNDLDLAIFIGYFILRLFPQSGGLTYTACNQEKCTKHYS